MQTVFVTGANRGIGHELARQCAARGDRVLATARRPETLQPLVAEFGSRVVPLACDVTDDASLAAAATHAAGAADSIDLLVNSAGLYSLYSDHWNAAATRFDHVDRRELMTVFEVNAAGPMLVMRAVLDLLRRSDRPRVLNLSSRLGSVSERTGPGDYAYAASKAALNIMTRAFAAEFRSDGIIAIAITPGWVRTDMGGSNARLSQEESVRGLLEVADGLTMEDSGEFLDYQKEPQPW